MPAFEVCKGPLCVGLGDDASVAPAGHFCHKCIASTMKAAANVVYGKRAPLDPNDHGPVPQERAQRRPIVSGDDVVRLEMAYDNLLIRYDDARREIDYLKTMLDAFKKEAGPAVALADALKSILLGRD